uniref:UDP-glycosyltransferase n=1 Tax=Megaselia scalaris TaxID=36166 RepID=T1GS16_MEGSC
MRGLAEAGHDVTVISHFPDKSPPAHYKDLVLPSANTLMNTVDLQHFIKQQSFYSHISEFFLLLEWGIDHCNATLKSKALLSVLKDRHKVKYDVIITEQFNSDCMMGVAHVLQAPVIALSSCAIMPWYYDRYSIPMNPSYNPALFFGQSENMNFLERLGNWITHHSFNIMYK